MSIHIVLDLTGLWKQPPHQTHRTNVLWLRESSGQDGAVGVFESVEEVQVGSWNSDTEDADKSADSETGWRSLAQTFSYD